MREEGIRVVVADDSPFVRRLLTGYLSASPEVEVVATAGDGRQAVDLVTSIRPQVVTLDLDMPRMDGLAALERIMQEAPTPVVMISGASGRAAARTLAALELGAVDFVLKYEPGGCLDPEALRHEIVAKVRAAARVKVIRSLKTLRAALRPTTAPALGRAAAEGKRTGAPAKETAPAALPGPHGVAAGVVVVGASTGGPVALKELLAGLPADFPAAVVVVQHMPPTFTGVLAAQLDRQVALAVREARDGDRLASGTALVAPGGFHLLLAPDSRVRLRRGPEVAGHCPSIDVTMQAVAQVYGARTHGVLLTGMGEDGAMGMVSIHAKGGRNFVQTADSCVVNGMPQRAVDKGVVDHAGAPWELARLLLGEIRPEARRRAC